MASFCSSRDELAVTRVLAGRQCDRDLIEAHRIFKRELIECLFPQAASIAGCPADVELGQGVKTWEVTGPADAGGNCRPRAAEKERADSSNLLQPLPRSLMSNHGVNHD